MTRAGRIKRGVRKAGEGRARSSILLDQTLTALKQPVLCKRCGKFPRRAGNPQQTNSLCIICYLDGEP